MQFVALHKDKQATDVEWPAMKAMHLYWYDAAKYIKQTACTQHLRNGICFSQTSFLYGMCMLWWSVIQLTFKDDICCFLD